MKYHRPVFLALLLFMVAPIEAASFDCKLARSPTEKAICSDPALSLMDEKLNIAFKATREQWSGAAREYVLNDQRAWLLDVNSEYQGQTNKSTAIKQLKERYRKRNRHISSPAYPLTGVYNKTNGDKLVVYLDTSERLGVMALKSDINVVRSTGDATVQVPIGSVQLNVNLPDGARNALDLCQLRLVFSANKASAVRKGQCGGANYSGSFSRDQKDNVGNYIFNK